ARRRAYRERCNLERQLDAARNVQPFRLARRESSCRNGSHREVEGRMKTATLLLFVFVAAASAQTNLPRVFLLDAQYLRATRHRIGNGDKMFAPALAALERDANRALKYGPVSVPRKKTVPPSGDKHDYMSEAPYFWPDPKSSNGLPYIRRDGERNPDIGRI